MFREIVALLARRIFLRRLRGPVSANDLALRRRSSFSELSGFALSNSQLTIFAMRPAWRKSAALGT